MVNSQKWMMLFALVATTFLSVGCRNCGLFRGGQNYGAPGCYPQNCNPGFANAAGQGFNRQANANFGANGLIPPPATGSLNIPSVARNTYPYNNRGGYGSGLNTNAPAPTPAYGNQNYNRSNGWRAADGGTGNNLGSTNPQPNSSGNAVSVLANNNNTTPNSGVRTAANTAPFTGSSSTSGANSSGGASYVDSPNYATTTVNETNDRTRLPINDASNVRAPSQYYQAGVANQVAQNAARNNGVYVNPGNPMNPTGYVGNPNYYTPNNVAAVADRQFQPNGYVGSFVGTNYNPQNYNPQNGFVPGNVQVAQVPPTVLAQSTTVYDPYQNGTRQADWRDRELGSESFR